ncbi:MAG: DMT family transporter [Chloroflexota bacterium]
MQQSVEVAEKETQKKLGKGINAALYSAFFLGLAPVFGKQAINAGLAPLGVVAYRTLFATLLLFIGMLIFQRKYLYIYPAGLIGCLIAGLTNGLGSLFYYSALGRIDAGLGQFLYALYPFFVAFWMYLDHHPFSKLTFARLGLAIPAVYLLLQAGTGNIDPIGVFMMLAASALYALHLPINQRILIDVPAPTVTLYTLTAMSVLVVPTYLFSDSNLQFPTGLDIWQPVIALTFVTFLSRITLFTGVKHLGGLQTSLLGLGELFITILFSQLLLGEKLLLPQWIGAGLLSLTIFLVSSESLSAPRNNQGGWFSWFSPTPTLPQINPPDLKQEDKESITFDPDKF